jgi:tryptophan synthase alpha chain
MEIEEKFRELREKGEGAYMPHVYYGDPNEEFSLKLIKTLVESGADLIEFGIPFSDPIADGPTFIAACERALEGGTTPASCIEGVKKLRGMGIEVPIVMTTYYNIPYVMGIENFVKQVKEAGVRGLIIPDLPVEESAEFLRMTKAFDLRLIFQVAPTTSNERLKKIISAASGFLYVINIEGVTGTRESLLQSTLELVKKVRGYTSVPLMAGFGISKGEHAKTMISAGADGVITGSAITEFYAKDLVSPTKTLRDIARFAKEIKHACVEGFRKRCETVSK